MNGRYCKHSGSYVQRDWNELLDECRTVHGMSEKQNDWMNGKNKTQKEWSTFRRKWLSICNVHKTIDPDDSDSLECIKLTIQHASIKVSHLHRLYLQYVIAVWCVYSTSKLQVYCQLGPMYVYAPAFYLKCMQRFLSKTRKDLRSLISRSW